MVRMKRTIKLTIVVICACWSVATYGAMYAEAQHWSNGYLSHEHSERDHMRALLWAIFPIEWVIAPFFTNGYAHGFQYRHRHSHFCERGEVLKNDGCEYNGIV